MINRLDVYITIILFVSLISSTLSLTASPPPSTSPPERSYLDQLHSYHSSFPHINALQWSQLSNLCEQITAWNTKVNLISRKDIQFLLPNHVIPSLSLSSLRVFKEGMNVIDVGCGGGFPSLPNAILYPQTSFSLLDSNSKKMMVVADIVQQLNLKNVRVITSRAEDLHEKYDLLLGRAVSAIPNFLTFSSHLLDTSKEKISSDSKMLDRGLLYLKGGDYNKELEEANIDDYSILSVQDLVNHDGFQSDKYILHIPVEQIQKFYEQMIKTKSKEKFSDRLLKPKPKIKRETIATSTKVWTSSKKSDGSKA